MHVFTVAAPDSGEQIWLSTRRRAVSDEHIVSSPLVSTSITSSYQISFHFAFVLLFRRAFEVLLSLLRISRPG